LFRSTVTANGALTASVYSSDEKVLAETEMAALESGVHLSCNLTGGVFMNQSATSVDFHASGANAAAIAYRWRLCRESVSDRAVPTIRLKPLSRVIKSRQ
jgi:dihydroxyacetone kinase